jgi:hypothetical protein
LREHLIPRTSAESRRGDFKAAARDRLTPCDAVTQHHLFFVRRELRLVICGTDQERSVSDHYRLEIDRHFAWFEARLPARPARFVAWLRKPSSRYVRIPLAIFLILGGVFSFLPVLGLWMLPLGLLLFAQDVRLLQKPTAQLLGWIERRCSERAKRAR